jgi:hypothetical protein
MKVEPPTTAESGAGHFNNHLKVPCPEIGISSASGKQEQP